MKFRPALLLLRTLCLWIFTSDLAQLRGVRRGAGPSRVVGAEARTLESSELLVGEWEVTVRVKEGGGVVAPSRRRSRGSASATTLSGIGALFPPRRSIVNSRGGRGSERGEVQRKRWYRCRLAVFPNQTFALRPEEEEDAGTCEERDSIQEPPGVDADPRLLPVRGRWSVLSNPYCVTDRFYDNLRLESYPRVQRQQRVLVAKSGAGDCLHRGPATSDMVVSSDPVTRVRLEFHGHLRGHHTAGGWVRRVVGPDRYHRGRIRNGVVLLSADDDDDEGRDSSSSDRSWSPWPRGRRRRKAVIATFTARRRMPPFRQLIQKLDDDHLKSFELYGKE